MQGCWWGKHGKDGGVLYVAALCGAGAMHPWSVSRYKYIEVDENIVIMLLC